jgi:hypothetical protein
MLNFAEQTGSGAVMLVWSFLLRGGFYKSRYSKNNLSVMLIWTLLMKGDTDDDRYNNNYALEGRTSQHAPTWSLPYGTYKKKPNALLPYHWQFLQ